MLVGWFATGLLIRREPIQAIEGLSGRGLIARAVLEARHAREHETRSPRKVRGHPHILHARGAAQPCSRIEGIFKKLAGKKPARTQHARRRRKEAAEYVKPVLATIEGKRRLEIANLDGKRGHDPRRNVGRVGDQDIEGSELVGGNRSRKVALANIDLVG